MSDVNESEQQKIWAEGTEQKVLQRELKGHNKRFPAEKTVGSKWGVPVDDQPHALGVGRVLHMVGDVLEVTVWTEERFLPGQEPWCHRLAQVIGTGQPFDNGRVVATAVVPSTKLSLVWHLVSLSPRQTSIYKEK